MNFMFVLPKDEAVIGMGLLRTGPAYVAACLKRHGYPVFGLELSFEDDIEKALEREISANNIDCVCIGALSAEYNETVRIIENVRNIDTRIKIILGGGMITASPELIMHSTGVDFGVIGQGEMTICELADALCRNGKFNDIDGLAFFENGGLVITKPRQDFKCIDDMPYPLYEIFQIERLIKLRHRLDIVASRSCPFNCTFCFHPSGSRYVQRSLNSLFDELEYWLYKYPDIQYVGVVDELFAADRNRIREFCTRIKKYNVKYRVQLRVPDVDDETLSLLRDSGCDNISFGIESANEKILKSMRKQITLEQINTALALTAKHGIFTEGNLIFGDVEEDIETANNSMNWWLSNLRYQINLSYVVAYPGTYIYKYAVQNDMIKDELQFLKDGCPPVNISRLSEEEYNFIGRRIRVQNKITAFVSEIRISDITDDSKCSGYAECFVCGHKAAFENVGLLEDCRLVCQSCAAKLTFRPVDDISGSDLLSLLQAVIENGLYAYVQSGKRFVIYGAGMRTKALLLASKSLRERVVYIVDKSCALKTENWFAGISVKDVAALQKQDYDCIIVTVVKRKDEVIRFIRDELSIEKEIKII